MKNNNLKEALLGREQHEERVNMKFFINAIIFALVEVEKGESIRNALRNSVKRFHQSKEEEATIYYFVFNIVRKQNVIDLYIKESSSSYSLKQLEKNTMALLRLATFIIKFEPEKYGYILDKLSNLFRPFKDVSGQIVLFDRIRKDIESVTEEQLYQNKDKETLLSLKYYTPTWMVRKILSQWGEKFTIDFLEASQHVLPTYIRVNTFKANLDEIKAEFEKRGIQYFIDKDIPHLLKIVKTDRPIPRLDVFNTGKIVIQQKSSALVSLVLNPKPREKILDMCASPGQKTSHLAALRGNGDNIIAVENNRRRITILKQRMKLLGVKGVKIIHTDARTLSKTFKIKFEKILLDPPCTGSGTFATRPDTKFRLKKRRLNYYTNLQKELLDEAAKLVKIEGTITYSTCSIFKEENIDVIKAFLEKNPNFSLEEVKPLLGIPVESLKNKAQMLFPHLHETEGFFIAKIKREN
ncbi:MAG: RsmB/NOP family class I SAM-dependent RNA methyltransferase [Candidatus Heimdallarchaeaceae archaeon]